MADELQHIYIKDDSMGFEQATEATLEQAGFVRASRLAAAEAEVERGMGIAQGQQIGYEVQLSTARSRITELEAHVSLQRETVETGQRYVSELESKLAAAEAMVEDARKLADWVLPKLFGTEPTNEHVDIHRAACRILASRPSEQRKPECPHGVGLCTSTCPSKQPPEQASKEDSAVERVVSWCPECGPEPLCDEDGLCRQCGASVGDVPDWRQYKRRAAELETQLAEAKADLSAIHDELEQWGFWKPSGDVMSVKQLINAYCELDAKLEAAEAERAHLHSVLEAVRVIHPSTVAKVEAAAATEEPKYCEQFRDHDGRYDEICGRPMPCSEHSAKPQPHPQGARLGGPADKLRADICEAIRKRAPILAQVADELEWLAGVGTSG